jgi:tripartite-type tricarboxylate transporter receptor subunit TctC
LPGFARAQNYPTRPVRLLVGFPPGGGSDVGARILANRLSEVWGQQVIVENKRAPAVISPSKLPRMPIRTATP